MGCLALVIGAGWTWAHQVSAAENARYSAALQKVVELDARLGENVASSRMGVVTHFDDLVRTGDEISAVQRQLHDIPRGLAQPERAAVTTDLAALDNALAVKRGRVERFKTEQAVLRSARRALPHSIERLRTAMATPELLDQRATVCLLLNDLLLATAWPDPTRTEHARCALDRLDPAGPPGASASPDCPERAPVDLATDPVLARLATGVWRHGGVVIARDATVDGLVAQVMTPEVAIAAGDVARTYAHAHAAATQRVRRGTQATVAMGFVVVLLGGAMVVTRLAADAGALRETTERLHDAMVALRSERDREVELARLKNRFVSMTSHEFRTPLSTILSSAELLDAYGARWDEARRRKHLQRIGDAGRSMSRMIDRVLVIGRADAELLELAPAPVDLGAVVGAVVDEVRTSAPTERLLELRDRLPDHPVVLDEKLLRHILTNLLSNAFKYSPNDTVVRLEVSADAQSVTIDVRDDGIGIPADELEHLFEPFHRCRNATDIPGTGLGMAIVKRCVDVHHGSLTVDSRPGVGSHFRVSLPLLGGAWQAETA